MKEKMSKLNEEIIVKFLTDECTEEELREVNAWLEESEANARELFRLEELYHLGKLGCASDEKAVDKAERKLRKKLQPMEQRQHKLRRMNSWMRYAALFVGVVLLAGAGWYFLYQAGAQPVSYTHLTLPTTERV